MLQDTWALKAQREGYRSRAVYKLEEILVKVKYNNKKTQNSLNSINILIKNFFKPFNNQLCQLQEN